MTIYYIVMAIFLIPAALILVGMIIALIHHKTRSVEQGLNQARRDLLKRESNTGSSELYSGAYSKISNEMLRDMAQSEGFRFVDLTSRTISLQRSVAQSGENACPLSSSSGHSVVGGDLGEKRQRENLNQTLSTTGDGEASLTLRRDELAALPKAEILHAAGEYGWTYEAEEISGNEWRLLFQREGRTTGTSQGATG